VALYAPAKAGKSLIVLALAAAAAVGAPGLDRAKRDPVEVLYLDYEMTLDDLQERLEAFGYGPESDLSHLHYASLPSLPPLNDPEGAKAVMKLVEATGAQVVVIDTFGRAVEGEENSNDTSKDFYRWTGLALKAAQVAYLRTDHAGKDVTRGQRGASAKNDDVDVVWQLTRTQGGVTLKATHRRMGWVPETVEIAVDDSRGWELSVAQDEMYPAGTKDLADLLDRLDVPITASFATANTAIRSVSEDGKGRRKDHILAAQRFRRESVESAEIGSRNRFGGFGPEPVTGTDSTNGQHAGPEPVPEPVGTTPPGHSGTGVPPLGGTGPQSRLADDEEELF
jgi:hypothetical protein